MIKNCILFIIVLLAGVDIQAQKYYPLVVEGNQWNELYKYGVFLDGRYETEIRKITGDTLVDGKVYMKLIYSRDIDAKNWKLWGLMREDIAERKVYYKIGENAESLFFDFSLKEGESIVINAPLLSANYQKVNMYIESINSILIKGEQRKVFTVKIAEIDNLGEPIREDKKIWIEGIGSSDGLFEGHISTMPGVTKYLLCFYQNGEFVYRPAESEYDDCFYWTTSINEITADEKFSILNQDNRLKISSNDGSLFFLEMYNMSGACLKKVTDSSSSIEINLNSFSDQLYLIRIVQNENVYIVKFKK